MNRRILVIDDDDTIPTLLRHFSKKLNFPLEIDHASDVGEAVALINVHCYDAATIDVRLPGVSGVSVGNLIREYDVNIPMAYLTNMDTDSVRKEAITQRAFFMLKCNFLVDDHGMKRLLEIIMRMADLNPCIKGGARIDNHNFPRKLPTTPLTIPDSFRKMLAYSKASPWQRDCEKCLSDC